MNSSYFNWQADLVSVENRGDAAENSLYDLLNSIPTDIPRNATKFDEELRNLIISLYSDQKRGENELKNGDKGVIGADSPAVEHGPKELEYSEGENGAKDYNEETATNTSPFAVENVSNKNVFSDKEIGDINRLHRYLQSELVIQRNAKWEIEPKKTPSRDKMSVRTSLQASRSPETSPSRSSCLEDRNSGRSEVQTLPSSSEERNFEFFESEEKYQQNVDELDYGKTARMLTSVSSWLSMMSNESNPFGSTVSSSLLDSSSLVNTLSPDDINGKTGRDIVRAERDIDEANGEKIMLGKTDNERISPDLSSQTLGVDSYMARHHSLSIISEESETTAKRIVEEAEDGQLNSESFLTATTGLDSGIASFVMLGKKEDVYDDGYVVNEDNEDTDVSEFGDFRDLPRSEESYNVTSLNSNDAAENTGNPQPISSSNIETLYVNFEASLRDFENRMKSCDVWKCENKSEAGKVAVVNSRVEHQIESLSKEYAVLVKEKVDMQKRMWELEEQIHIERKDSEGWVNERKSFEGQRKEMLTTIQRLEDKLGLMETRSNEREGFVNTTVEKLSFSQEKCTDLMKKIAEMEDIVMKKTKEIECTKKELQKSVESCKELSTEKNKYENDLRLISEAFQKLKASKNWLEFQLKSLSESRTKMEVKFDEIKAEVEERRCHLDYLQNENMNLSSKLMTMNFNSVKEKEELFKNMEKIEQDMMKSQADYNELENKYEMMRSALDEKNKIIEIHEEKIKELINILKDADTLEMELRVEISDKDNIICDLKRRVSYDESKIEDLEAVLSKLKIDYTVVQEKCNKLNEDVVLMNKEIKTKDDSVEKLRNEKEELGRQLEMTRNEKLEFEQAARDLRQDMIKVDRIFQVMKRDLATKSSMLDNIESKKQALLEEMKLLQQYVVNQDEVQRELRGTLRVKIESLRELSGQKEALENDVNEIKIECRRLENELDIAVQEKKKMKEELEERKEQWENTEKILNETINLEKQKHQELLELNEQANTKVSDLSHENLVVVERAESEKKEFQVELAKLRAKENKLAMKLKEKQNDWILKEQNYEASIMSFVEKLKEESVARQKIERDLSEQKRCLEKRRDMQGSMKSDIVKMRENAGGLKEDSCLLRNDVMKLKSMNSKMLSFMTNFVNKIKQRIDEVDDQNKSLLVERDNLKSELMNAQNFVLLLENQKKVEAVRAMELEDKLGVCQKEVMSLKKELVETNSERDSRVAMLMNLGKQAEGKVEILLQECNELRERCKKAENLNEVMESDLRQHKDDALKLRNNLIEKEKEAAKLMKSSEEASKLSVKYKEEKINQERAYAEIQGTVFDLENQLGIEKSHGLVLEDQVKNLKWQLKQSTTDADARAAASCKEQHQVELENAFSLLNVAKTELKSLRDELLDARKAKQYLQMQLAESDESLRHKSNEYEMLNEEVCKRNNDLLKLKKEIEGSRSAGLRETVDFVVKKAMINVKKLPGTGLITKDRRSHNDGLELVRRCMTALRHEMDSLHSQMSLQMKHLQSSKDTFRNFDENLEDLQIACNKLHEKSTATNCKEITENQN